MNEKIASHLSICHPFHRPHLCIDKELDLEDSWEDSEENTGGQNYHIILGKIKSFNN